VQQAASAHLMALMMRIGSAPKRTPNLTNETINPQIPW
jgi:hypothetical protein